MVNFYLHLKADEILNYFDTEDNGLSLKEYVFKLGKLTRNAKKYDHFSVFYDPQNVDKFIENANYTYEFDATYIQELRSQFRHHLSSAKQINNYSYENSCQYFKWVITDHKVDLIHDLMLKMLIEKVANNPEEKTVLIAKDFPDLVCFKDAPHRKDLPNAFIRIETLSDLDDWEDLVLTYIPSFFSLKNTQKFQQTSLLEQGVRVYKELETNYYWYLDNFHKTHYEVFDKQGDHLSEANLLGTGSE